VVPGGQNGHAMLICYGHSCWLPQGDLTYMAFCLSVLNTFEGILTYRDLGEEPDITAGFLVHVSILAEVPAAVQIDLLGEIWIDNWDPLIACTTVCADYDTSTTVTETDYLLLVAEAEGVHDRAGCALKMCPQCALKMNRKIVRNRARTEQIREDLSPCSQRISHVNTAFSAS